MHPECASPGSLQLLDESPDIQMGWVTYTTRVVFFAAKVMAGWKSMLVPDAVVRHVVSASSGGGRSKFATYHGHRNMLWVYLKNMPGILFWLFLPPHIMANLAFLIVLTLRGQAKVGLRAKIDAIKGLPKMWKRRQLIQSKRVASVMDIWRAVSLKWG